jgi:hypothetical protein
MRQPLWLLLLDLRTTKPEPCHRRRVARAIPRCEPGKHGLISALPPSLQKQQTPSLIPIILGVPCLINALCSCITCKIRRIKCDETKPTCRRCQKAQISCDGYGTRRPESVQIAEPLAGTRLPIWRMDAVSSAFSERDAVYFELFRAQLVHDLSGYCYSDFWSRIVLCESMTDGCVRESVLAIAALSQAVSHASPGTSLRRTAKVPSAVLPWTADVVVNDDHRVALHHYTKALSIFRNRINAAAVSSPRWVLIMTLLLITFELLQGNMKMADGIMTNGIKLLKDSIKLYRQDSLSHHGRPGRIEDDMADIEHMLPFLSLMGAYTPFLTSQQTNFTMWDTSPGRDLPDLRPTSIMKLQTQWGQFFTRAAAFIGQALVHQLANDTIDTEAAAREQQTFLAHLRRWQSVLDLNLARATTNRDRRAKRALQMMQLHHIELFLCINCCLDYTELAWDAYDAEFLTLVVRCVAFVAEADPAYYVHFTLSTGLLSPLEVVIVKCRNHDIRMQAAEVLRRLPWREGAWDASLMVGGKLGGVLLEERGRGADGLIPPEHRWFWVRGDWNMERRRMVAQYVRAAPDKDGVPVTTSLEIDMDVWPDVCREAHCSEDHSSECIVLDARVKQSKPQTAGVVIQP